MRRPASKRGWALLLVSLIAALAVAFVAFGLSIGGGEDEEPPVLAVVATPASTPSPSPTPAALPELPPGCNLIASHRIGESPSGLRAGEAVSTDVTAQPCAVSAWRDVPLAKLTATMLLRLEDTDGPRELRVELSAERTPEGLTWTGSTTYPEAGLWDAAFELGSQTLQLGPSEVLSDLDLVPGGAGTPLVALPQQVTVLHIDRPDEPVRWEATGSAGLAWIPGRVPGEPARAVWLQSRNGEDWAVAGDPTSGAETALFKVDGRHDS